MKKILSLFGCIVPFLVALLVQIALTMVFGAVYGGIQGSKLASEGVNDTALIVESVTNSMTSEILLLFSAISVAICILIFGLWYKKCSKGNMKARFIDINRPKILGYVILLGFGLQFGLSGMIDLVYYIKPEWFGSYLETMESLGMGSNSLISIVFIALIAPVAEEFIFRGVIMEKCNKIMPFAVANIVQALLFGLYHFNMVQGIYAFFIGLCLGLVCYKLKSVYAAIILHMVVNIFGLILNSVSQDSSQIFSAIYIAVAILSYGLIFAGCRYFYSFKNNDDNVYKFSTNENT